MIVTKPDSPGNSEPRQASAAADLCGVYEDSGVVVRGRAVFNKTADDGGGAMYWTDAVSVVQRRRLIGQQGTVVLFVLYFYHDGYCYYVQYWSNGGSIHACFRHTGVRENKHAGGARACPLVYQMTAVYDDDERTHIYIFIFRARHRG